MRTKVLLLLALAAIVNGAPGKLLDLCVFIMNVTSYHAGSSAKGRQGSL